MDLFKHTDNIGRGSYQPSMIRNIMESIVIQTPDSTKRVTVQWHLPPAEFAVLIEVLGLDTHEVSSDNHEPFLVASHTMPDGIVYNLYESKHSKDGGTRVTAVIH